MSEQKAIQWVLANTPSKDVDQAKWIIALWHTENLHELSHKEIADELAGGSLNMEAAYERIVEFTDSPLADDMESLTAIRETMIDYFSKEEVAEWQRSITK